MKIDIQSSGSIEKDRTLLFTVNERKFQRHLNLGLKKVVVPGGKESRGNCKCQSRNQESKKAARRPHLAQFRGSFKWLEGRMPGEQATWGGGLQCQAREFKLFFRCKEFVLFSKERRPKCYVKHC